MFQIIRRGDLPKGRIAEVEFEGSQFEAGISFFIGDLEPGEGPPLHKHPYAETCIIHSGQVLMEIAGKSIPAGPGDIVVIDPETPHQFIALGPERLQAICIHASDRFVIQRLGF